MPYFIGNKKTGCKCLRHFNSSILFAATKIIFKYINTKQMEDIFKTLGNILKPEVTNSTLQTILNEIGKPFHYYISFNGDSNY